MAFPTTPSGSWTSDLGLPSRLFGTDGSEDGFELYEQEDAFVLSVEMPGFDPEDIDLRWDDGRLYVAAEHTDDDRGRRKRYYRSFRLPKRVVDDDIEAEYTNGVLEVTIPIAEGTAPGEAIPIES
ncbi:Hsp20/alpha crystallin family protein [Natronomonas gomsonensis]|jgi:HSP20 family protein|uniref:Hsp20/alpha crystallin family protein n=1 Tax=Natronomonas gomsonensis TaxID=1046043 RepID=UPI0020CA7F03|nr:Hsp20/alpha crystallin family protein [Natronomonas gomsonensis]MCY4731380.1 Hsp20/alpha crystallin family protein [Natronomonas gomsonensis]